MNDSYKEYASKEYVDNSRIQADLNQNDSTAPDYVKGRLCYEEVQVLADFTTTTLYEEVTFEEPLPLVIGEKYIVSINDVEIESVCGPLDEYTPIPRIVAGYMVDDCEYRVQGGTELLTITMPSHVVIKKRTALVKLPEKFIPDSIERVENTPFYVDYATFGWKFYWEDVLDAYHAKRPIHCIDTSNNEMFTFCDIYEYGTASQQHIDFCGIRVSNGKAIVRYITLKGDNTKTDTTYKLELVET
jgi:hypothetical protein